uniref:PlxyGVORF57 protein n=1 Tax=Plutella xylostella granulovirus TaxID=98383 RepID=A0A1B2CSF5_9BBAC|nr:PlxyGVORF57 protein [Plutella xylostella granulovirus]
MSKRRTTSEKQEETIKMMKGSDVAYKFSMRPDEEYDYVFQIKIDKINLWKIDIGLVMTTDMNADKVSVFKNYYNEFMELALQSPNNGVSNVSVYVKKCFV